MRKTDVLDHYKTMTAVAKDLGITVQAVSDWDELIPPFAAFQIASKNTGHPKLGRFDQRLYRHSSLRTRRIAARLSA